jgi:hypothetical protein
MKKVLDDQSDDFLCKLIRDISLNVLDSKINFDNYNIASINQDIIIKDKDDKPFTAHDVLYYLDKENQNSNEIKLEILKKIIDYRQKLLIKEDISKVIPNANNNNNMYIGIGISIGIGIGVFLFTKKYITLT